MERGVCNRARGGFMKSGWMVKGNVKEACELQAVAFLDHIPGTAEGQWDVSEEQYGSVMAWTAEENG